MRKFSVVLLIVFFAGSGLAAVEIGPGLRLFQYDQGSNVNFSQSQNFSQLGVRSQLTDFGDSILSVEPGIYEFSGENSRSIDVSGVDSVDIQLYGAGGQSSSANPGQATEEDTEGGYGGYVETTVDVTSINQLQLYVGESPQNSNGGEGGWGWQNGGATDTDGPMSGGGGGATAVLDGAGNPIAVAGGGGGGWGWDTFTVSGGGGGAPCGSGGDGVFSINGEDAECTDTQYDVGGDGGGTSGDGEDYEATYQAEDGTGLIVDETIASNSVVVNGSGSEPDEDGRIRVIKSSASTELDFYKPLAGRQEYVSNFTVFSSQKQKIGFKISDLPSNDFYEAFFSNNDTRIFIGYTDSFSRFNFSTSLSNADLSIFNYGEKGVAIDNIAFNDSEPIEGETLGIEEEIFNEGVVDDEAVNKTLTISTFNGSSWEQKEFRSEDLAVPVNSTETQQSFTAKFKGRFTNTTQYRNGGGQLGLGYQNGTAGDNLVGYWRMDEAASGSGGTVVDYSGEENDGVTNNGVETGENGILGTGGMSFDGTDSYTSSVVGNLPNAYTVGLWVKTNESSESISGFSDGIPTDGQHEKEFFVNGDGTVTFRAWDGSQVMVESDSRIDDGEWHHLAATAEDNGEVKIYVDGNLEGSSPIGTLYTGYSTGYFTVGIESDLGKYYSGSADEVRIYNRKLSSSEVKDLYFNSVPFRGSYKTEEIQEGELTHWYRVNLDANVPDQTDLDAEFRALDSNGNIVDTDSFGVEGGDNYYNVSVQDSEGAELYLNGSSQNLTKSWEVNQLQIISGGPYVDPWEAKPGPWRFNVSLDPNDEVKETDETNNNFSETLDVDSYQVFYGDSESSKVVGADKRDIYRWRPEQESGLLFFYDVDASFKFEDLEPVNSSDLVELDSALRMRGHNDSIQELWDRDSDGSIDRFESYSIEGRTLSVPVTNSSKDSVFDTGILYDSGDGSGFNGSQDIVFVSRILDNTTGGFGSYDYEARVPFYLGELRDGSDRVEVFSQLN